jgi:iron complex transport system ATP-binding protein
LNPLFELRHTGMRYNGTPVLAVGELDFARGQMVSVVGPNGAGKSTLLGVMAGLREGYTGECCYQGREVSRWSRRRFARSVSFVPQNVRLEFPFTAEQVVLMGRTPYCNGLFEAPEDHDIVERAMETTDTLAFRSRDFRSLSGGARQRIILASALAQGPKVLLLDEPTSFLDIKHQLTIQRILRDLCRKGLLVVAATHDLNLAAAYSDRVVTLDCGRVVADAPPQEALTADIIRAVFGVDAVTRTGPEGRPWIRYET